MKKISNFIHSKSSGQEFQISNSSDGFTLIELLIVFTIIAVLSALIFGNLYVVPRMRDGQRKSNLRLIQHALEQYKADQDLYPLASSSSGGAGCAISILPANCSNSFGNAGASPSCSRIYLKNIPKDPNGSSCSYYYEVGSPNPNIYRLAACLENKNDNGRDVIDNTGGSAPLSTFNCTRIYLLTSNP